jgi:hypothetical protein
MPELAQCMRVERARRDARQSELAQALDHLAGCLVGERDDEDLVRRHHPGQDRVGGTPADDARLPGSRSREDHDRSTRHKHRLALCRLEVVEQVVRVVGHGIQHPAKASSPGPPAGQSSPTRPSPLGHRALHRPSHGISGSPGSGRSCPPAGHATLRG